MEILAIASTIFFIKVLICCTLLQKCKPAQEKVKKETVNIEKICKDSVTESTELTIEPVKRNAPKKPPRACRSLQQSVEKKSDNSNSLQKTILTNNSETFWNDDYIRSKVYGKLYYNQCWLSSEKEAGFQGASIQSERHFKDALLINNESQEQIPSSGSDIDSSKSLPQISELTKLLQLRFLVNSSSESRNCSQCCSQEMIVSDETICMNLPKMHKEIKKNVIYPLTSTKIRSKNSPFHKLRKYLVAELHRIFKS